MKTVHIIERFNTAQGLVIMVVNDKVYKVGDRVKTDMGETYIVTGIQFNTKPTNSNIVSLLVHA